MTSATLRTAYQSERLSTKFGQRMRVTLHIQRFFPEPYAQGSRNRSPLKISGATRAMKEYLATLNDTAFGAATEVQPKFVSAVRRLSDERALKGPAFFAYANNYLIDLRHGVIVAVEASRTVRQARVGAARTMLERTEKNLWLKPQRLAADTA
jgi:hypothetical protein